MNKITEMMNRMLRGMPGKGKAMGPVGEATEVLSDPHELSVGRYVTLADCERLIRTSPTPPPDGGRQRGLILTSPIRPTTQQRGMR